MSFSSMVKEEVCRIVNLEPCCMNSELAGTIIVSDEKEIIKNSINTEKDCCKKAFLRGVFLATGSMSAPEKSYHLEIVVKNVGCEQYIIDLLNAFGLKPKKIVRNGNGVIYLKESEDVVDFLNIIGAHKALLEIENVRVLKDVRNSVNRVVNCETANLEKTVNAALKQIEDIKLISEFIGLENLPKNLREIAYLRLENIDSNLTELGEMLSPPIGKSGVNHRFKKLDLIARNVKEMRGV